MSYNNPDNATTKFIDEMFNMLLESVPKNLVSTTSKRDLIKNIKDLYAAKGTSEGHKLFMRILLGETADRQEQDIGKNYNDGVKQSEWSEEYMSNFIENFEETKRKKRNKKRRTVIED